MGSLSGAETHQQRKKLCEAEKLSKQMEAETGREEILEGSFSTGAA